MSFDANHHPFWEPWLIRDKDGDWAWGIKLAGSTMASGMAATSDDALRCIIQAVLSNPKRFTEKGDPFPPNPPSSRTTEPG